MTACCTYGRCLYHYGLQCSCAPETEQARTARFPPREATACMKRKSLFSCDCLIHICLFEQNVFEKLLRLKTHPSAGCWCEATACLCLFLLSLRLLMITSAFIPIRNVNKDWLCSLCSIAPELTIRQKRATNDISKDKRKNNANRAYLLFKALQPETTLNLNFPWRNSHFHGQAVLIRFEEQRLHRCWKHFSEVDLFPENLKLSVKQHPRCYCLSW